MIYRSAVLLVMQVILTEGNSGKEHEYVLARNEEYRGFCVGKMGVAICC